RHSASVDPESACGSGGGGSVSLLFVAMAGGPRLDGMLLPRNSKASARISRLRAYPNYLWHNQLMFARRAVVWRECDKLMRQPVAAGTKRVRKGRARS